MLCNKRRTTRGAGGPERVEHAAATGLRRTIGSVSRMPDPVFSHPGLEVDVTQVATELDRGSIVVIDVREPHEWEAGRIAGAVHIPLQELMGRIEELDRERTIVFQCRVGGRSGMAAQALRESGYDAWSLAGGLLAWDAADRPLTPDGGVVADH